jgi:hypothetical protein
MLASGAPPGGVGCRGLSSPNWPCPFIRSIANSLSIEKGGISMDLRALGEAIWAVPCSTLAWGMVLAGCLAFVTLMLGPVAPYGRCAEGARAPDRPCCRHPALALLHLP